MDNQHRKIAGYRELSPADIDLMNRIKDKAAELLQLHSELTGRLSTDLEVKRSDAVRSVFGKEFNGIPYTEHTGATDECHEYRRFVAAEPLRWAAIGKTDIQTGIMALVRSVAQPGGC